MPLFFDSNVILGFCFSETDHWGPAAAAVMNLPDTKYTSDSVWKECFGDDEQTGKAGTILKKLRRQVRMLCKCLSQPDCEPDLEQKQFSLIASRVRWFKEQGKTREEMIYCVRTLQQNFETVYYQSKDRLSKQLNFRTRREAYKELYNQLISEISNSGVEPDPDDLEIILDAHDLARTTERLILVTGDKKHIVAARGIILQKTMIFKVKFLRDYTQS